MLDISLVLLSSIISFDLVDIYKNEEPDKDSWKPLGIHLAK